MHGSVQHPKIIFLVCGIHKDYTIKIQLSQLHFHRSWIESNDEILLTHCKVNENHANKHTRKKFQFPLRLLSTYNYMYITHHFCVFYMYISWYQTGFIGRIREELTYFIDRENISEKMMMMFFISRILSWRHY